MAQEEADKFASFLSPLLHLSGEKRAAAKDMTDHPWLGGVVVQGELDEMERAQNRGGSGGDDGPNGPLTRPSPSNGSVSSGGLLSPLGKAVSSFGMGGGAGASGGSGSSSGASSASNGLKGSTTGSSTKAPTKKSGFEILKGKAKGLTR